jgi:cyclin H
VNTAYSRATGILKTEAVVSDAYFLYTPPQIVLAALLLADDDLALTLYSIRLKRGARSRHDLDSIETDSVLKAVRKCSEQLRGCAPTWREDLGKKHLLIEKKLRHCRNPEKVDLVERQRAKKRDATVDGQLDDTIAKKRKMQRENAEKEGDDLFGPALAK